MISAKIVKSDKAKYFAFICLGMFIKLFALHHSMGIDDIFRVTVKNLFIVMAILCFVSLISKKNSVKPMLFVNLLLSILLFIDALYYGHFYTLIRAHSIYQFGQVKHVSDSIVALMRPLYFLYFLDSILIFVYLVKDRNVKTESTGKQKLATALAIILLVSVVTGMNSSLADKTNGYFTPHNSGVINFHLYDVAGLIRKASIKPEQVMAMSRNIIPEETGEKGEGKGVEYFGLADGRNVIVIQAESLQNFVINTTIDGQEITPVLNELLKEDTIYFSRYYEQIGWGNTSDAEFITHNGYYASNRVFSYRAYEDTDFMTLPKSLKAKGYSTAAFHGNDGNFWSRDEAYPNQGLDRYISIEDMIFDEEIGLGLSDGSFFKQSIPFMKDLPQPFYSFFITLTSHHPFLLPEQHKQLELSSRYKDTPLDDYLQTVKYLDREIGNFIEMLKAEDLYEDSIIVIYGDHKGLDWRYSAVDELVSELIGKDYRDDEMYRVPFMVHIPNSGVQKEVETVGGQVDFYATMANLLGVQLRPDSTFGKDLLNTKNGFAAIKNHVARGSFVNDEIIFIMSEDGIFENSDAWNINTGEQVDVETAKDGYLRAVAEIKLSEYIMQRDMVKQAHRKGIKYILETIKSESEDR